MNKRMDEYSIKLYNEIADLGDFPNIIGTYNNELDSVWVRNYKDKIKVGTCMSIKGLKPDVNFEDKYLTNVYFEITTDQAIEIIQELQKALDLRKKRGEQ